MIQTFIKLPGYAIGSPERHIPIEKINHYYRIEYNGRSGTCIVMDNGQEITTDAETWDVEKCIENAQRKAEADPNRLLNRIKSL